MLLSVSSVLGWSLPPTLSLPLRALSNINIALLNCL